MLLAAEVTRLTVASRLADTSPHLAARLAPRSPVALASLAMAEVGRAAAQGETPPAITSDRLRMVAATAPLQPEPFLVAAALAEKSGQQARAEALLMQARQRDPRSTAARYLLADIWLREGKIMDGLGEMGMLAQLLPGTADQLVPSLAEYAHSPGAADKLRVMVEQTSSLKLPLLDTLATDPANADLVLSLAGTDIHSSDPRQQSWKTHLLTGFVKKGDYARAYALWHMFAGLPQSKAPLLFNGDFSETVAPPPFNWRFSSGAAGVAEPEHGRLRVLYYGRDDATLASQMLLLAPGRYRFQARVSGSVADGALTWTITCAAGDNSLLETPVATSTALDFNVGPDCRAQMLQLNGISQDMPQSSDVRIGPVAIERVSG